MVLGETDNDLVSLKLFLNSEKPCSRVPLRYSGWRVRLVVAAEREPVAAHMLRRCSSTKLFL